MKTLCISDAHLADPESSSYEALINLLERSLPEADTLLLMGDIFELWLGDNQVLIERHASLLNILRAYRKEGKEIIYLKGNHDFILGSVLEKDIGVHAYNEEASLAWDGHQVLASHGEHINRQDYGYRLIRILLRHPFTEKLLGRLNDGLVVRLADTLSTYISGSPDSVKEQKVLHMFFDFARNKVQSGYEAVLLAHTHVPQWHVFRVGGEDRLYANPGSWADQKTYVWYRDGRFQVCKDEQSGEKVLFDFAPIVK